MRADIKAQAIAYPTPVFVVSTYNEDNSSNAMTIAWGGLCSSEPPCVMIAIRRVRCTYENIQRNQAFVVNIADEAHVKEADYFGIVSGKKENKLEVSKLSVSKSKVNAPLIDDFPMALECKCIAKYEVGSQIMVIGEIVNISVKEEFLDEKGNPDIEKVRPITLDPVKNYYTTVGPAIEKAFSCGRIFKE